MTGVSPTDPRISIEDSFIGVLNLSVDPPEEIGRLRGRLPVVPALLQPMGIVHGGVYASIAETLASMGTARAVVPDGHVCMGMSNNTSFLRPVSEGTIHGDATALHRGRTTWVWDIDMRDDAGRLCATSRVTMAVR
ncbi:MAG: PaaI family thioesterase [Actinomycetota bacterium]